MEDRLNVILDLDNTIINALEEHERQKIPLDIQKQYDYKDMATYGYRIFGRPGLQEFLDFLSKTLMLTYLLQLNKNTHFSSLTISYLPSLTERYTIYFSDIMLIWLLNVMMV
jgi:hypothetical protein